MVTDQPTNDGQGWFVSIVDTNPDGFDATATIWTDVQ